MVDAQNRVAAAAIPTEIRKKFDALVDEYVGLLIGTSVGSGPGSDEVKTWQARQGGQQSAGGVPMVDRITGATGRSTVEDSAREQVFAMLERGLKGERFEIIKAINVGEPGKNIAELWSANTSYSEYGCSPDQLKAYLKEYISDERFKATPVPLP